MSKEVLKRSRAIYYAMLGMVAVLSLAMWGCGTSGYDDPVTTTNSPSVIDAVTLKKWVDEGKLNASQGAADRVVVVSLTTFANYTTVNKGHIPGAVLMDTSSDLYSVREEGLGPVPSMVPSGGQMDTVVKKLGIDNNTTIVLTIPKGSTDNEHYQQSRGYFTFRYWGFGRDRVKILNGGDDAWDVAGLPLTTAQTVVSPSTYSVNRNNGLKDVIRYSVGEMLSLVDSINKNNSLVNTWQILDLRSPTITPFMANARRTAAMQFLSDRVNGEAGRNRLYPDSTTLLSRMGTASLAVKKPDGTDELLSPTKKTVVMCGSGVSASPSFVLFDAVLGVPEGNIMMYDGSSSQWTSYSTARITSAGASALQAAAWAFDANTPSTVTPRSTGPLAGPSSIVPGNFVYSSTQSEMDQIENADRTYMLPTGGSLPAGGGSAGGGC